MLYNTIEGKLDISHGSMDYAAFGYGRKPVVLIPGLSLRRVRGSGIMLAQMYRALCKEFRIVVFDRRDKVYEGITAADFAQDIVEGMERLGIKNAHVIGISQGGMIAQYLALDHPEKVAKTVLGVTLSRPNDSIIDAIDSWTELIRCGDMKAFVGDMMYRVYSESYIKKYEHIFPLLLRFVDTIPPERFIILAKSCLDCNTYDRLDSIKKPVLVLGGRKDKVVSGEASEEIAEKLGCGIYMYEDLGHSAYEEAKDFNTRIFDFLTAGNRQSSDG